MRVPHVPRCKDPAAWSPLLCARRSVPSCSVSFRSTPVASDPRRSDPLSLGHLLRPVSACTVRIWDLVQAGSWGLCVLMYQADV